MINYLIQFTLCSGLFLAVYLIALQNERMHKFNRLFLVLSLVLSLVIPVLSLDSEIVFLEKVETTVYAGTELTFDQGNIVSQEAEKNLSLVTLLLSLYLIVSTILLARFIFLNGLMIRKTIKGELIYFRNVKLILLHEPLPPHSYLNYIFLSKSDYTKGIKNEILEHELAHINQKHTVDILFVELLIALAWCNPTLYFYRSAIRLNHEYLADSEVIKSGKNMAQYVELILSQVSGGTGMQTTLTSSFNHFKTKKRLIMMTKNESKKRILLKQVSMIPVLALALLLFSKTSISQEVDDPKEEVRTAQEQVNQNDQELQAAFDEIINKYIKQKENGRIEMDGHLKVEEKEQLKSIYLKMSKEQQEKQLFKFVVMRFEKKTPTENDFEKWEDPKIYGVWVDTKRIPNDQLSNYSTTDFSHYGVSKLAKNAKNYGKHIYQVSLMSNESFKTINDSKTLLMAPNFGNK